jgi:hypothetical protein
LIRASNRILVIARVIFVILVIIIPVAPVSADVPPEDPASVEQTASTETPEDSSKSDTDDQDSTEPEEPEDPLDDPCRPPESLQGTLIDQVDQKLYTTVCASARWFDSFFGDARAHDEASTTYGTVSVYLKWTEHDQFEPIFKGRVNIDLPNAEKKMKLFVGRLSPEEFLTDTTGYQGPAQPPNEDDEEDWLVGLGYTPLNSRTQRINLSVGVRVDWPPDPYTKVQYRWYHPLGANLLFRFRQTGFWYLEDGFGTTTNLDFEHRPRPDVLIRTSTSATFSEATEGVKWWLSSTAFRQLSKGRAIGGRIWIRGETEAPVEVREYGFWVLFRKRLHREWLYGDIATGLTWPQDDPFERRETSWGIALGIQIQFGDIAWDPDEG